jgi:hypothetical protein
MDAANALSISARSDEASQRVNAPLLKTTRRFVLRGSCTMTHFDTKKRLSNPAQRRACRAAIIVPPTQENPMPKYVIERDIPNAGKLTPAELHGISQTSCGVLSKMGPQINWVHSYVTGDKIYCIYIAPNAEMVREHAKQGGFPANKVSEVTHVIDPTTAE